MDEGLSFGTERLLLSLVIAYRYFSSNASFVED